jgi:MYXO-CTERM domain-containing protein
VLNLAAGETTFSLAYTTHGYPAKDILIDKVYLINSAVPEAGSVSMMLAGLAAVGLVAARRRPAL